MSEEESDDSPTDETPRGSGVSENQSFSDRLNALLDRPVFDPESQARDEPKLLRRFRKAFNADPELATTLYVGFYFALLLCFAQQGVRIFKHCYFQPDRLCPWEVGLSVDDVLNF